jgi:hypothetical protein
LPAKRVGRNHLIALASGEQERGMIVDTS